MYVYAHTHTRTHAGTHTRARIAQAHALSQQGVAIATPAQSMHVDSQSGA